MESIITPNEFNEIFFPIIESCRKYTGATVIDIELVIDHIHESLRALDTLARDKKFAAAIAQIQHTFDQVRSMYSNLVIRIYDEVVEHYGNLDELKAGKLYAAMLRTFQNVLSIRTLPFFTLNYDSAVEAACEQDAVPYVDGFDRLKFKRTWSSSTFDSYEPVNQMSVVLFKMHGSVTWCRNERGQITQHHGLKRNPPPLEQVILYPSLELKELGEEPYRTAYDYLDACLQGASTLVIIGTTLRDRELGDIVRRSHKKKAQLIVYCGPDADADWLSSTLSIEKSRVIAIKQPFGKPEFDRILEGILKETSPARRWGGQTIVEL